MKGSTTCDLSNVALRLARGRRAHLTGLVAVCLLGAAAAHAATGVLDLGRPTSNVSTNPRLPLSGFHRTGIVPRAGRIPALVWLGTAWQGDSLSSVERWPLVKALQFFGSFTGMASVVPQCLKDVEPSLVQRGATVTYSLCGPPTFDWSRARYHSRYLTFIHADLIDNAGQVSAHLSPIEARFYDRYVRQKPGLTSKSIAGSIVNYEVPTSLPDHAFPLLAAGGYVQTQSAMPLIGDFTQQRWMGTPSEDFTHGLPFMLYYDHLTFDQARSALASGKSPSKYPGLVADVNAETNVITAIICHADGGKPEQVCSRRAIKSILKHVK